MRVLLSHTATLLTITCAGCASVPPLADDGVTISEIVQRVKCEIWEAAPQPSGPYPTGPYQWMRDWTAKVDLSLETDDTGGVTPGVSFIRPMQPQTLPGIGTFSRMFTFGLGGGVNTTASRTETLSFTLSFAELRNQENAEICRLPKTFGLLGNLGLREWMAAALAPTRGARPELRLGYHAAPSSSAKAATPKPKGGAQIAALTPVKQEIKNLEDTVDQVTGYADESASYAATAQKIAKTLQQTDLTKSLEVFMHDLQQAADYVAMAQDAIDEANKQIALANAQIKKLQKDYPDDTDAVTAVKKANANIAAAKAAMTTANQNATAAVGLFPPNPPIDSIAHQVSFVVTFSANASPNWTLVHFKGPTTGNTFASASRSFTHTLNISMGSPSTSLANVSPDQIRQLDYLHQSSAFRNALILQSNASGVPF